MNDKRKNRNMVKPEPHSGRGEWKRDAAHRRISRWILDLAAVVIVIAGIKSASAVITQVLLVAFISIILSPVYYFLKKYLRAWLALAFVIGGMVLVCFSGIAQLSKALIRFSKRVPEYHRVLVENAEDFDMWFREQGVELPEDLFADVLKIDKTKLHGVARHVGTLAVSTLQHLTVILIIVSFVLCELSSFSERVRKHPRMPPELWEKCMRIALDVRHYMGIKTLISLLTAGFIYIGLIFLHIDSALILSFAAFVLNFIPIFGSIASALPAIAIALVNYGMPHAVYVIIVYVAVNQLVGNILEPKLMGYGFGVSPVLVLFSVIFWGWVLGPVGALFAVPITMALKSSFDMMNYGAGSGAELLSGKGG